jgi:hypothetical protein
MQMRAEVKQEVEEINRETQASPPSAQQSCSRAGGHHKEGSKLVTMRVTEEAVEEFLGQIAELASWNTANGCPVPNMMPGIPSPPPAKIDQVAPWPSEHTHSNSGLANYLPLQQSETEAKKAESICRKEKREILGSDADISKHVIHKSRTINQHKDQLRIMRVGEADCKEQELDQIYSDEENEASKDADGCSNHDDDQNSGSSSREGSSESGAADYARTMAAAEASYSTFDIPKVLPVDWIKVLKI